MQKLLTFLIAIFMVFSGANLAHAADAPEFTVTTTPDTSEFGFWISAAGTFTIDWGDGSAVQTIEKSDITNTWYSHTYSTTQSYTIGISGDATAYSTDNDLAAISFYDYYNGFQGKVAAISGRLTAVFPTLSDGTGPRFNYTFRGCTSLTSIPGDLFAGITSGVEYMFEYTFSRCTSLTSIPGELFASIKGPGATRMFSSTFSGCTSLTSIPGDLFAGITSGADGMFASTFHRCTSLTSIPGDLFAGITSGASYMFQYTFSNCTSLTSIPGDLFASIQGPGAGSMFSNTFSDCSSLTSIPGDLFKNITTGAEGMFFETFRYCTSLTSIPGDLFKNITTWADGMFFYTFWGCSSLTGYVNGNTFTVPADGYGDMYLDTFYGADNMMKTCPENTYAVPKPSSSWTVAVCNKCPENSTSPADSQSIDACVCDAGYESDGAGNCVMPRCDTSVRIGGVSIPMYKEPQTEKALAIPCGDDMCYIGVIPDETIPHKYYIHAE